MADKVTNEIVNPRPDLSGLSELEVLQRRRAAAAEPLPRSTCPGCLRALRGQQPKRGWCRLCRPSRDRILTELLRVPDPAWWKPAAVAALEAELALARGRIQGAQEALELLRRQAAGLEADLRYARAEASVCLQCGEAPAERPATYCRQCQDIQDAPAPAPAGDSKVLERVGRAAEEAERAKMARIRERSFTPRCDVCDERPATGTVMAYGLETSACGPCRGQEDEK